MLEDVTSRAPEEACGLLAGIEGVIKEVFPIENALHSPSIFRMDPQQQIDCLLYIEKQGWELVAIYHSHPEGPAFPSETDLNEFAYPGTIYLIWAYQRGEWTCQAFRMDGRNHYSIAMEIVDGE